MAIYDLSELIDSLQSARDRAQKRSEGRQQRLLEHMVEIGMDGEPKSLSWVSRLPSGDGGHRTHELIRLPWASLRSNAPGYVATVSITFDCEVAPQKASSDTEAGELKLIPVQGRKEDADRAHRLEINLGPGAHGSVEILLDDQLLKGAGSDAIQIPPEIVEELSAEEHRPRKLPLWKLLAAMVLSGVLAAAAVWFLGVLFPP